ncbi:MAG: rhomboid family intramembrane serine protease [Halobacteriales archaeon]|nr:rhomboid family intramembrane serine protease [Halobacteriales archaeon]
MAGVRCSQCGKEEVLPFRCTLCSQPHCLDHRLPENHGCQGLSDWRVRSRDERVVAVPEQERERIRVRVRGSSAASPGGRVLAFFRRSTTNLLLAVILLGFLVQWLGGALLGEATGVGAGAGIQQMTCWMSVGTCGSEPLAQSLLTRPWTPVTALFAHAGPVHLFFNALFLYFIGHALEARIGGRKLLGLFLATGVLSGLVQVAVFPGLALGASGGLMGLLGVLTILAPTMQVIFYFFPVPLYIMTVFIAVLDIAGVFGASPGIANAAHLVGLALGLAYGYRLRRRGVLPRIANPWAFSRRL